MADTVKIGELDTISTVGDTDYAPAIQSGITKRFLFSTLWSWILSKVTSDLTNFIAALGGTVTSWTPTLIGSSTAGTQTYVIQVGRYIKFGRLVHIQGYVEISAKDVAMAGSLRIGGLPFVTSNVSNNLGAMACQWKGLTLGTGLTQVVLGIPENASFLDVYCFGSATTPTAVTVANTAASSFIVFSGTYISKS